MTASTSVTDTSCPLIALQRELNKHRGSEKKNDKNETIVTAMFDAYRSNLVAPDHLLTGLAKNVLSLLLEVAPTHLRSHVDIRICDELRRNRLLRQNSILKSNRKGLASMSLSSVLSILIVAVPVFEVMFSTIEADGSIQASTLRLSRKLATLISRTYWTPQIHIDGKHAVAKQEEQNGYTYLEELRSMAVDYIEASNQLCTTSTIVAKHLDKRNLHRILELYTHTLPAFGHVSHFIELVFETAHQPLKRCIVRGNHPDDHISAVEHSLGNDWQSRIRWLYRESQSSDQSKKREAVRGLKRVLMGIGCNEEGEAENEEVVQSLLDVFVEPVVDILQLQGAPMNLRSQETGTWVERDSSFQCKGVLPGIDISQPSQAESLSAIWNHHMLINPFGPDNANGLPMFKEMARRLNRGGDLRTTGNGVDVVGIGDPIQVLVNREIHNSTVFTASKSSEAVSALYCIVCLIDDGDYGIVAGVLRRDADDRLLRIRRNLTPDTIQLLPVNDQLKRIGTVHACHEDCSTELGTCKIREMERDVVHSRSLLEGGSYYYMTRPTGYPPRVA